MNDEQLAGVIGSVLRVARLRVSTEAALQKSIAEVLDIAKIPYAREKALGPKDRPDFLCGRVVIEAKARYRMKAAYRQIERYAAHDSVGAIVLVTATATGMPATVNGKPIIVVATGLGALGC